MIVLDASALVEVLLRSAVGRRIQRVLEEPSQTVHAPHLVDLEVASVLRRLAIRSLLPEASAARALALVAGMDIQRYSHTDLLPRIWELRNNVTPYDAAYLALSEALSAPLVTCDAALAETPGCGAEVTVVRD